jgi:hypothetical protein
MADLGNLTSFLKSSSVSNLDWLDVDEEEYRSQAITPRQNLDISPDLEACWDHQDKPPSSYLVPNKDIPRTLSDLSQAHKRSSKEAVEQLIKIARLSIMQSTNLDNFRNSLVSRFDSTVLANAKQEIANVLQERGLLGQYYVDSNDFSNCYKSDGKVATFIKKYANKSKFVISKDRCSGCVHNSNGTCAVFKKKLVIDVPYTNELADAIERSQISCGKSVQASNLDPRGRIKSALLAKNIEMRQAEFPKPVVNPTQFISSTKEVPKVYLPVLQNQAKEIKESSLSWDPTVIKASMDKRSFDVVNFLRREMLKGYGEKDLIRSLKLSFSKDDLNSTRSKWEPVFKQAGYYGTVYSTQESFDSCNEGADFLARYNPSIKGIVSSGKCSGCIYNKLSRCLIYGRPLVVKAEDLYTPEVVSSIIRENRTLGKLETGCDTIKWGKDPAESIKNVYRAASQSSCFKPIKSYANAFYGNRYQYSTGGLTKREVVKYASRYMNEGLYGEQLFEAMKKVFDVRDIKASSKELKKVLAEQGLQGIFYIDPMVYDDYAKGCNEGSRIHRSRLVPYLKMGEKCSSCVLQTQVGYCSKYSKNLVIEPPYTDKIAQQKEILLSGKSTEIKLSDLICNDKSIVAEFALRSSSDIELNPEVSKPCPINIEFGGIKVDL